MRLGYTQIVKQSRFRWWDAAAVGGLLVIVFMTATSLELTYWTYDLNRVTAVAVLSLLSGMLIGASTFSRKTARLLLVLYGLAILFLQLVISLNVQPLWIDRLIVYARRADTAVRQLLDNRPLEDGILFLSSAAVLFGWAALSLGYHSLREGRPGGSLALFALVFYAIQFFLPPVSRRNVFILVYTLVLGLLVARWVYVRQTDERRRRAVKADASLSAVTLRLALLFTLPVVLIAFGLPIVSQRLQARSGVPQPLNESPATASQFLRNFLFPLRQPAAFGSGDFAEVQGLGSRRSTSAEEVFTVDLPVTGNGLMGNGYWYGRVYASYQNGYWQNADALEEAYETAQLFEDDAQSFTFHYSVSSNLIFRPQILQALDQPARLQYYPLPDDGADILALSDPNIVRAGTAMRVQGAYNQPAQASLRHTGQAYPAWVLAHYLQLPANLSPKVAALAQEAARGAQTPFDVALNLTDFLRGAYRYQDAVRIPRGAEPLEWFLFSGRAGFCNYYATAETLMLRSLGIPARFVTGYAGGQTATDGGSVTLLARDSHAWVEVYFPDIGWVIFEPTPRLPSLEYLQEEMAPEEEQIDPRERFALSNPQESEDLLEQRQLQEKYSEATAVVETEREASRRLWLALPLALVLVGVGGWWHFFHIPQGKLLPAWEGGETKSQSYAQRKARRHGPAPVEVMAARLRQLSPLVGVRQRAGETAREYFSRLFRTIELPEKTGQEFIEVYEQAMFAERPQRMESGQAEDLVRSYHRMLAALLRKWWGNIRKAIRLRLKILRVG
ncbi:MAG: hypothetical protein PWQ55_1663 [Chloroflexota bacterium]|nr:hypothetical protein [Chloroflexota bacterium]